MWFLPPWKAHGGQMPFVLVPGLYKLARSLGRVLCWSLLNLKGKRAFMFKGELFVRPYWYYCIFIDLSFQVLKTVFAIYVDCWLILTSEQVLSDGICTQRLLTMAAAAPYLRLALVAVRFAAQRLYLIDPSLCWVGFLWRLQRAQRAAVGHLWLRRLVVAKHASWLGWVEGLCLLCFLCLFC